MSLSLTWDEVMPVSWTTNPLPVQGIRVAVFTLASTLVAASIDALSRRGRQAAGRA